MDQYKPSSGLQALTQAHCAITLTSYEFGWDFSKSEAVCGTTGKKKKLGFVKMISEKKNEGKLLTIVGF